MLLIGANCISYEKREREKKRRAQACIHLFGKERRRASVNERTRTMKKPQRKGSDGLVILIGGGSGGQRKKHKRRDNPAIRGVPKRFRGS